MNMRNPWIHGTEKLVLIRNIDLKEKENIIRKKLGPLILTYKLRSNKETKQYTNNNLEWENED